MSLKYSQGLPHPIGATVVDKGVNFSVYAPKATKVILLLFDGKDSILPYIEIDLQKKIDTSYYYWHLLVEGIGKGQFYAYRVDGEYNPAKGLAFDKTKVLIDPYARGIYSNTYDRTKASINGVDNLPYSFKSIVTGKDCYNWEGVESPQIETSDLIIYEMHVKGFTYSPSSGLNTPERGTYAGVIEKIPYLKSLGINAVELMPVFAYDHQDAPYGKNNYWGYSPINFFAIHNAYSISKEPIQAIEEFKDMVKALHKAEIEVILDVVYNHTSESGYVGPTLCMRGFDNEGYYMVDKSNKEKHLDYTGCGNTFNSNHSVPRRMIIDSLKYWVEEMHVDGFRFDLASVLSRNENGKPILNPPTIWSIESEPSLEWTKLIAEAWDASGLYQLGVFTGEKWAEWNGKYRDDIRKFMKGDPGMVSTVASRIVGSPDVFKKDNFEVSKSIHFITCHDGFTLNDLVSYNQKHNAENGESNLDGANENYSWNSGKEGMSEDEDIERLRLKMIKNFYTISMLSQGTPMLLMGDEVRRSQKGNNNAYSIDSELNWFDWDLVEINSEVLNFVRTLVDLTKTFEVLRFPSTIKSGIRSISIPYITWHGTCLNEPDWGFNSHTLGFEYHYPSKRERILVYMNMYWEELEFELPTAIYGKWNLKVDTSQDTSEVCEISNYSNTIKIDDRCIVVLIDN